MDPVRSGKNLRARTASEEVDEILHVLPHTDVLEQFERRREQEGVAALVDRSERDVVVDLLVAAEELHVPDGHQGALRVTDEVDLLRTGRGKDFVDELGELLCAVLHRQQPADGTQRPGEVGVVAVSEGEDAVASFARRGPRYDQLL